VVLLGAGPVPSWLILHSGVRAFTLDDGADATMATVCPTLPLYLHGPDDAAAPRCLHERPGVSVVIESIDGRRCVDFESQTRVPCVRIRAMDGSWSGYTGATTVAPAVPVGTLVDLAPQPIERLTLAPKPAWKSGEGTDLGARVRARVIRYVPSTDERELFVSIINGPHVGATGWVYAHTATLGGLSVTEFLTGPASQRR
jgi:hypothetical protein